MSLFAAKKIVKEKGQDPEAFELDVAQVRLRLWRQVWQSIKCLTCVPLECRHFVTWRLTVTT